MAAPPPRALWESFSDFLFRGTAAAREVWARSAMEFDINPQWVQLAYAKKPGWRLRAGVTGQARPADHYLIGRTRDFIAVMARG